MKKLFMAACAYSITFCVLAGGKHHSSVQWNSSFDDEHYFNLQKEAVEKAINELDSQGIETHHKALIHIWTNEAELLGLKKQIMQENKKEEKDESSEKTESILSKRLIFSSKELMKKRIEFYNAYLKEKQFFQNQLIYMQAQQPSKEMLENKVRTRRNNNAYYFFKDSIITGVGIFVAWYPWQEHPGVQTASTALGLSATVIASFFALKNGVNALDAQHKLWGIEGKVKARQDNVEKIKATLDNDVEFNPQILQEMKEWKDEQEKRINDQEWLNKLLQQSAIVKNVFAKDGIWKKENL